MQAQNQGRSKSQGVVLLCISRVSAVCIMFSWYFDSFNVDNTKPTLVTFNSEVFNSYNQMGARGCSFWLVWVPKAKDWSPPLCSRSHRISSHHRSPSGWSCWQSCSMEHPAAQISQTNTPRKRAALLEDSNSRPLVSENAIVIIDCHP